MKVCCGSGKVYDSLTDIEKLGCNHDHCLGPIQDYLYDMFGGTSITGDCIDLLTVCGTFDTSDCISHEDLRHLFNKADNWEQWMLSQIEQEGVDKYKAWYARMLIRCDLHSDLIEAHNKLFNGEMN